MAIFMKDGDIFYGFNGVRITFWTVTTIVETNSSHVAIQALHTESQSVEVDDEYGRHYTLAYVPTDIVISSPVVKRVLSSDVILCAKHYKLFRWNKKPIFSPGG